MGLYDRSYYGEERRGIWQAGGRSMVVNLIIANVVIYVADLLSDMQLAPWLGLDSDWYREPWLFWQPLSYGFVHARDLRHILFNMFFLWWFGSGLEAIYGRAELLRIYLVAIVVAGLTWVGVQALRGSPPALLVGASGGVMGLMILYVFHFPRQIIYIWGILPIPAWAFAGFYVLIDVMGATQSQGDVANVAHLAGAAFGFLYFQSGRRLGGLIPTRLSDLGQLLRFRPRLRVHQPRDDERDTADDDVDAILEKISREGEASLTKRERRTLEEASRRYQRRRR